MATQAWGPCFNGTSAASPVAAGAAALVRQSGLSVEPSTVRAFLTASATDRSTPGVDNVTGYGEVTFPPLPPAKFDTGRFNAVTPFRLIDTRFGQGDPGGKVAPGNSVKAKVAGVGSVPATGVTAVVLNITATQSTSAGYLQAYPHAWGTIGGASTLNLDRSNQTVADLAVVPVGAGRHGGRLRPARVAGDHRRLRLLHEGGDVEGRPLPGPQPGAIHRHPPERGRAQGARPAPRSRSTSPGSVASRPRGRARWCST